jgi:flagellar motility protein MotE (MotC chaperone)
MKKMLTSTWMTLIISAIVYLGATVLFWKMPTKVSAREIDGASAPGKSGPGPSWEFVNPETDQLLAELQSEKKALEKKAQLLGELEARLQAERTELGTVTQSVHQLQTDFDSGVVRVHDEEAANLKKLAKVYSAMAADSAANILAELDDVSVVKIMAYMKDTETAGIFEAMAKKGQPDAKRAANLSERLRLTAFRTNNAPGATAK